MNLSWIFIVIVGACIGVYYLYKQGRLPWLKGVKMPKMFEPKPDDLIEKLKAKTEKEVAKAEELRGVLEAKRGLVNAQAANAKLRRDIEGVSEKSLEKEKQEQQKAQDAQKVKPKSL